MSVNFDPTKLSEDELFSRINRARSYLDMQLQLGHTATVNSISDTLRILEDERSSRFTKQRTEEQAKKTVSMPPKSDIVLGDLDTTPRPNFIDTDERKRSAKIRRRRI